MTITSKQESILQNILTTINGIDGTGDYNLDLSGKVWRVFVPVSEIDKANCPCACIIDEYDTKVTPMTSEDYTIGDDPQSIMSGWPISILVWLKVEDDIDKAGLLQKEIIKSFSDVAIAMLADTSRGGHALSTALVGISKRVVDHKKQIGGAEIFFIIKYDFNPVAGTPVT